MPLNAMLLRASVVAAVVAAVDPSLDPKAECVRECVCDCLGVRLSIIWSPLGLLAELKQLDNRCVREAACETLSGDIRSAGLSHSSIRYQFCRQ